MEPGAVYRRSEGVIARTIGAEVLLVPVTRGAGDLENIFSLNPVGAHVWERADGRRTAGAIVDSVLEEFAVERAEAEADVASFLREMEASGLLQREKAETTP
jgi:hypothetical protein